MQIKMKQGVKITPLLPNQVPKNKLFVCPESAWMPDSDGNWQLHPFAFEEANSASEAELLNFASPSPSTCPFTQQTPPTGTVFAVSSLTHHELSSTQQG